MADASPPEVIWLLDQIRDGVRWLDNEREDSVDQIRPLKQIVKAAEAALVQLEARKTAIIEGYIGDGDLQSLREFFARVSEND